MCVSEKNFQAVVKGNELQALISSHPTPASPFLLRYSLSYNHNCFSFVFSFLTKHVSQWRGLLRKPPTYHLRLAADLLFLEMR